jgi:hypothetical protein
MAVAGDGVDTFRTSDGEERKPQIEVDAEAACSEAMHIKGARSKEG